MRETITTILVILALGVSGQIPEVHLSDDLHYLTNIRFFNNKNSDSSLNIPPDLVKMCKEFKKQKNNSSNELAFLRKVFYKVQHTYFKTYTQYSTLEDLLLDGRYDCVSGTALYALIINSLGFQVEIRETPFHAFLLVYLSNKQKILIESTSPTYGFITEDKKIAEVINQFIFLQREKLPEGVLILNRDITIQELSGLESYNQAVYYFNKQDFVKTDTYLNRAKVLYPCQRVMALVELNQIYAEE